MDNVLQQWLTDLRHLIAGKGSRIGSTVWYCRYQYLNRKEIKWSVAAMKHSMKVRQRMFNRRIRQMVDDGRPMQFEFTD